MFPVRCSAVKKDGEEGCVGKKIEGQDRKEEGERREGGTRTRRRRQDVKTLVGHFSFREREKKSEEERN